MKTKLGMLLALLATSTISLMGQAKTPELGNATHTRCGWYDNPTPANLSLTDADGTWWITTQGQAMGPDAEGAEDRAPPTGGKQWIETQGKGRGYGYGCACLTVVVDAESQRIMKVVSGRRVRLSQCRADKNLPKP